MRSAWGLLICVLVLGPGCLSPGDAPAPAGPEDTSPRGMLLSFLEGVPPLTYRSEGVDWWEDYVTGHSLRQWPLPTNADAATFLEAELSHAGFETAVLAFTPDGREPAADALAPGTLKAVQGLRQGSGNATHRLVLTSHYDTVFTTTQGAYDDGSGVAAVLHICKTLAQLPMNKTLECLFFNNEENGALASQAYTDWYAAGDRGFVWDQAFGYDMVGLNWPGYDVWKLYTFIARPDALPASMTDAHHRFLEVIAYDFLGPRMNATEEGLEILDRNDRNSDERNFQAAGIPVLRFAGGRRAADYPEYHKPNDTVDYVYRFACSCDDLVRGKETFAAGFDAVVTFSVYTILAYDRYDPRDLGL